MHTTHTHTCSKGTPSQYATKWKINLAKADKVGEEVEPATYIYLFDVYGVACERGRGTLPTFNKATMTPTRFYTGRRLSVRVE